MKHFGLILFALCLSLVACHPNRVEIRGEISGFTGKVKLIGELPEQVGSQVLCEQDVTDGKIDLKTDALVVPARVFVDLDGKRTLDVIVDTKDQIWIQGKAKFIDQVDVKGSGLATEYQNNALATLKDKYDDVVAKNERDMAKLQAREKPTPNDYALIDYLIIQRSNTIRQRAKYVKSMIESNLDSEVSMLLLDDQLKDSVDLQKRLFKKLKIENQESTLYKVLQNKYGK